MNKPWQQLVHEDDDTFAVFMLWLMMPPERDLTAAYGKHVGLEVDGVPTHLQDAYDRDDWVARAHAYDIAEERREMYWWENNRKVWKRAEYEVATKIMGKAQEMLDWPIDKIELTAYDENGKEVTLPLDDEIAITMLLRTGEMDAIAVQFPQYQIVAVQVPAKWAFRDLSGMVRVASDIARLSAEMEKSVHKFVVTLSPEAVEAMEKLEAFGVTMDEVLRLFERQVIDAPGRYELSDKN